MICLARILLSCSFGQAVAISKASLQTDGFLTFDSFVDTHRRDFKVGSAEYEFRRTIYERRLEDIRKHNAKADRLWTAGVSHLTDRTDEEFQGRLGWRHHHIGNSHGGSLLEIVRANSFIAEEKDYMNLSSASHVVDQGGCGSCWAVATSELLKAHYEIHNGSPRAFSAQELVSCVKNPKKCGGKGGCEGATVELALDYVMNNGLRTASEKPYTGSAGRCDLRTIDSQLSAIDADGRVLFATGDVAKHKGNAHSFLEGRLHGLGGQGLGLMGFYTLPKNKYNPLVRAVIDVGPVGITIAASDWSMYSSGVFQKCDDPTLNHAVLLMGIGKDGDHKTYIVKNSWGSGWGENGYIRLLRTDDEESNCATDHSPKDGVACEGGPSKVEVCGTCGILYDNVVPSFQKAR